MSRKRWKGILLNEHNIDEYMDDLINDTKGQFITQGVSFNKNDAFQMTLLKNALISNGSFSGFVKHLMFIYFEKNNSFQENAWKPKESETPPIPIPTPAQIASEQAEIERKKEQLRSELLKLEDESNLISHQQNDTPSPTPSIEENKAAIEIQIVEEPEKPNTTTRPERKAKFRDGTSLGDAILPPPSK